MSRRAGAAATALAVAALLLTVLIVARVSAKGGAAPSVLASAPPRATTTVAPPSPAARCDAGGGTGGLRLGGACTGGLPGPFACVAAVDDLYLTGRHQVDGAHVLYLTINVESYRSHPGDYQGAQAVLQLTGPVTVQRWSNYAVSVHVNTDGSVIVPATDLAADPGTGSTGTVAVSGSMQCGQP